MDECTQRGDECTPPVLAAARVIPSGRQVNWLADGYALINQRHQSVRQPRQEFGGERANGDQGDVYHWPLWFLRMTGR